MPEVVEPDSRQSRPLQKRGEAPVYNVLGFVRGVPFELVNTRSLSCYSEPAWSIKESAASVASRDRASGHMSAWVQKNSEGAEGKKGPSAPRVTSVNAEFRTAAAAGLAVRRLTARQHYSWG